MTNTELLRNTIQEAGLKYKFIASELSLTPFGLQKKINNITEFKASEIAILSRLLKLSVAQQKAIFFTLFK